MLSRIIQRTGVKVHRRGAMAWLAVLGVALWGPLLGAQEIKNVEHFRIIGPPSPPVGVSLEEFRSQLLEHYDDLLKLNSYLGDQAPPDLSTRVSEARQNLLSLGSDELSVMYTALARDPQWRQGTKTLLSLFEQMAENDGTLLSGSQSGAELLSHSCPAGSPMGIADVFIARGVAQTASFLLLFVPQDLVTVVVAGGFGGGGTISAHPLKIALQFTFESAQAAALVLEGINAVAGECEQNNHTAILHDVVGPRVDVSVSSRASQASLNQHDDDIKARLDEIDARIQARFDQVDAALAHIIELLLTPQGRRDGFPKK